MDNVSPEKRSQIMRSVRSNRTSLENMVCTELWRQGYRFRRNVRNLVGTPDIAIKKYKLVIFLDSCFWHYCEIHRRVPKTNTQLWLNKLKKNEMRDKEITQFYVDNEWHILRIWEHQLKDDFDSAILEIINFIKDAKSLGKN